MVLLPSQQNMSYLGKKKTSKYHPFFQYSLGCCLLVFPLEKCYRAEIIILDNTRLSFLWVLLVLTFCSNICAFCLNNVKEKQKARELPSLSFLPLLTWLSEVRARHKAKIHGCCQIHDPNSSSITINRWETWCGFPTALYICVPFWGQGAGTQLLHVPHWNTWLLLVQDKEIILALRYLISL